MRGNTTESANKAEHKSDSDIVYGREKLIDAVATEVSVIHVHAHPKASSLKRGLQLSKKEKLKAP